MYALLYRRTSGGQEGCGCKVPRRTPHFGSSYTHTHIFTEWSIYIYIYIYIYISTYIYMYQPMCT